VAARAFFTRIPSSVSSLKLTTNASGAQDERRSLSILGVCPAAAVLLRRQLCSWAGL